MIHTVENCRGISLKFRGKYALRKSFVRNPCQHVRQGCASVDGRIGWRCAPVDGRIGWRCAPVDGRIGWRCAPVDGTLA